ncbi:MAG: peptide ABC transporter substrate-binding protein, partial [Planctomycetes bacterium]|nr:peptide ABC transporter substrate-binding protein [Planctomycetota bacterium]
GLCVISLWGGCNRNADPPVTDAGLVSEPVTPATTSPPPTKSTDAASTDAEKSVEVSSAPAAKPQFQLGDMLDPFEAPPLAELDAQANWIDRPVSDGIERLRERQANESTFDTVEKALSIRNDSEESNRLICAALGRLPAHESDVDPNAKLVRHTYIDMKSTNPLMQSSVIEQEIAGMTSFGLFSFDWNFQPFASADSVRSWQSSADRMYDKVVMRDDLTWSDGHPITAHDVEFSFKAIMSKAVPALAVRHGTDKIKWVHAYDDHTLVFFHKEPLATNDWNIFFSSIPKHVYEKSIADDPKMQVSDYHVRLENSPVVGGPYRIASRTFAKDVILEARPDYYMHQGKQVRRAPRFQQIRFLIMTDSSVALLAVKRGDIDEFILQPQQWQSQTKDADFYEKCTKAFGVEWVNFHFLWNCKTPYFSDKRVRQAMSYAFDHEELLKTLLYGLYQPCNGMFHHASAWCPPNAAPSYQQNLDRAEELLQQAGWSDSDGDGVLDKQIDGKLIKFEFTVNCADAAERVAICNLLRESLDQIGVKCNVRPLEFTVLTERGTTHAFEAM